MDEGRARWFDYDATVGYMVLAMQVASAHTRKLVGDVSALFRRRRRGVNGTTVDDDDENVDEPVELRALSAMVDESQRRSAKLDGERSVRDRSGSARASKLEAAVNFTSHSNEEQLEGRCM